MESFEFFIEIILPAAPYRPDIDSACIRNEYQEYLLGKKVADA